MSEKLVVVAHDFDDAMVTCNEYLVPWFEQVSPIELGQLADPYTFSYPLRFPDAIDTNTGKMPDFNQHINNCLQTDGIHMARPKPGVYEHLERIGPTSQPVIITARPGENLEATKLVINRLFSDYFEDFETQLILPDLLRDGGEKPKKLSVAANMGAVALVDDAIHNLNTSSPNGVARVLFRDEITMWNHVDVDGDIHVANGWSEVTPIIGEAIVSASRQF